jgi:hypothetical protein
MMHLFGIADEAAGLRAVLIEGVLPMQLKWAGPAYDYVLSSAPEGQPRPREVGWRA